MKLARLCCFATAILASIALLADKSLAQVNIPFQVTAGSGLIEAFPSAASPAQGHTITAGSATFNGVSYNYTGSGKATLLGPLDPATGQVPFNSVDPFLFDFGGGNTLLIHYGHPELGAPSVGTATIAPLPTGMVDVTWLATFNPVPGSGTGIFANVTGGSFFMTAKQFAASTVGTDLPYSWSSDMGYLTVVPEPSMGALAVLGSCALLVRRRFSK